MIYDYICDFRRDHFDETWMTFEKFCD
jgi:hypothetical protein